MKFKDIDVISPALFPKEQWNEAEVLGAITWLWLSSENCKHCTLADMARRVLPVIKSRQFALFSQDKTPLGYISWANLDERSEAEYVHSEPWIYSQQNWNCGDHMWLINWFAPLGHSALIKSIIETDLFPEQCCRALYHKGAIRGLRVMTFHGKLVSKLEIQNWNKQHPIQAIDHE